jgi:UPF0716 protein FxsA
MRWIFLLLPWVELYGLIQLGGRIGGLATLAYVFLTLVLGLSLVRLQGLEIVARLRAAQQGGLLAGPLLADDLAVGLAGVLLMVPGLVTDFVAAAVLVGPLWRRLTGQSPRAGTGRSPYGGPDAGGEAHRDHGGTGRGDDAIEGEYRRLDDD